MKNKQNGIIEEAQRQRLRMVYEELGMSQRKFAASIGIEPTSLSGVFSRKNRVTSLLARSIELEYGYKADWILKGEEPKKSDQWEKLYPPEKKIFKMFRQMTPHSDLFGRSKERVFAEFVVSLSELSEANQMSNYGWVDRIQRKDKGSKFLARKREYSKLAIERMEIIRDIPDDQLEQSIIEILNPKGLSAPDPAISFLFSLDEAISPLSEKTISAVKRVQEINQEIVILWKAELIGEARWHPVLRIANCNRS